MEEQQIIKEYQNGKSILQLKKENTEFSYRHIQKILVNNNIPIRGGRKKIQFDDQQLELLKKLFYEGQTYDELVKIFQVSEETLRNIIKSHNYVRKNNNRINKNIKSDYFSNINSSEKAYWLGFLYTDGSVDHYRKTGRVRLQLQKDDINHLKKFQQCLNLNNKIIADKRENKQCLSVEFNDEQIFNDLSTYGIVPNKTYKTNHIYFEKIPIEFIPAFLLGLFDGDGDFSCSKDFSTDVSFGFTSYCENCVKEFQEQIDKLINKITHNKVYFTSAWHTKWRGRLQVLSILDILYSNCPIHLDRKYNLYLSLKNSLK